MLASRSPQRRAILEQLGIDFSVTAPDVEEERQGEPREVVVENALRKARAIAHRGDAADGGRVLGVDTEVVLDGRVSATGDERSSSAVTRVRFRRLEEPDLAWYIASGEWRDRAGAYAIQGRGAALVESIEGDFWNVVGLPVAELLHLAPDLARDGRPEGR